MLVRYALTLSIAALCVALAASGADAASTSPGKNSAYESASGVALPSTGFPSTVLTATIAKGKPKRVLEAVATISVTTTSAGGTGLNASAQLLANGIPMEPQSSSTVAAGHAFTACYEDEATVVDGCVLTITGWLDLDAAELANPGVFKSQPVAVELSAGGFDAFNSGVSGDVSLIVRMEKK